jgi:hypothetical protein
MVEFVAPTPKTLLLEYDAPPPRKAVRLPVVQQQLLVAGCLLFRPAVRCCFLREVYRCSAARRMWCQH